MNVGENPLKWEILVKGAATCMTKHAGICNNHTTSNQPFPCLTSSVSLYRLFLSPSISLPGSFTGSTNTEASAATATTDSVDQVSPTMPRATKNRVSGKLRRSASAISKSSNWALQPVPYPPPPPSSSSAAFNLFSKNLTHPAVTARVVFLCFFVLFCVI